MRDRIIPPLDQAAVKMDDPRQESNRDLGDNTSHMTSSDTSIGVNQRTARRQLAPRIVLLEDGSYLSSVVTPLGGDEADVVWVRTDV